MTNEIRFYHLTTTTTGQTLPTLLQRTLERNWRAVVLTDSQERVTHINQHLWTYDGESFLPHGSKNEGEAECHPVWITDTEENPNNAQVLFLLDNMTCDRTGSFDLICILFDGNNTDAVSHARTLWKQWANESPCPLTYWQQTDNGSWEKKATAERRRPISGNGHEATTA